VQHRTPAGAGPRRELQPIISGEESGCRGEKDCGGRRNAENREGGGTEKPESASGLEGGRDRRLASVAICIKRLRFVSCRFVSQQSSVFGPLVRRVLRRLFASRGAAAEPTRSSTLARNSA